MLVELNVQNYAVAETVRVRFQPGLNLLTGETGSGKSILVDALSLLFGERSSAEMIRAGGDRARIGGIFEAPRGPELGALLDQSGLETEAGELIIEREIFANGKSRAYVNGRPVTIGFLRELAPLLGDIHGQHEQQDLFSPRTQLAMLDDYAGVAGLAARAGDVYRRWRECGQRLAELRGNEQERLRLLDLYRFQEREIREANLEAGEEQQIEREQNVLSNLARIEQSGAAAYDMLYDSSVSALAQIKQARRAIAELASYDGTLQPLLERLETAAANIEDVGFELQSYLDKLEPNPGRLAEIDDRLGLIEKLKRKYGPTLEDVIAYGQEAASKLDEIASSDASSAKIEAEQKAAANEYERLASDLSQQRQAAAKKLAAAVEKELASLAMEKARFEITFDAAQRGPEGWGPSGIDRVSYLVAANPGQPARPLDKVASGGELSRITLALKTCLFATRADGDGAVPRTLVFDEIDTGVGGRVAESLGRRLQRLAASHQVLCVTHLPQIAGFASAHYYVEKSSKGKQTQATIVELSPEQRVEELARMLSGAEVTAAAMENARQMLDANGPQIKKAAKG